MEYRGMLKLSVPGDFITIPAAVTHKELDVDAEITVRIEYMAKEYWGRGKSLDWTDAFADLQKALPDGVEIHCCLTCRYGTICPYGNFPDYVLCSQNVKINSKDDVIDWLDEIDVKEVKRSSFDWCGKFEVSNENYYTYNDFFHFLNL